MTFYITDGIFYRADTPPPSSMQSIPFEVADDAEEITVPDGVTSIWRSAFSNRPLLKRVHLPSSLTHIARMAFSACTALEEITIPDGVIAIGNNAFDSCTSLRRIVLPDSITSIAEYTFLNCASLRSISLPSSVKTIGTWAFCFCFGLEEITLPDSVTSVGFSIFRGCRNLRRISIAKHHLTLEELSYTLTSIQSVHCIAPIDEIPDTLKFKACIGFAENEAAYPKHLHAGYLKYLRFSADARYKTIPDSPALLRLMCREKMFSASSLDRLLEEVLRRENTELTAVVLEYKHMYHFSAADDFCSDLTLD